MNGANDSSKNDDWSMTMPHLRLGKETKESDFSDDFAPSGNPKPIEPPADDWGMSVPNVNLPKQEKQDDWSMPAPVFRNSEGEKLDEVAKRTSLPNLRRADMFDKTTPNFNLSETSSPEAFDFQSAPPLDLQAQPSVSEEFPASQMDSATTAPAKSGSSKIIFIVVGLFIMLLFAATVLIGSYFLFFKESAMK